MRILINIPEEIYKASKIIDVQHEDVVQIPLEVIANGIPIPKDHGDLKDVEIKADKAESEGKERNGKKEVQKPEV